MRKISTVMNSGVVRLTLTMAMLVLLSCEHNDVNREDNKWESEILVPNDPTFKSESSELTGGRIQGTDNLNRIQVRLSRDPAARLGTLFFRVINVSTRQVIYQSGTMAISRLAWNGDFNSLTNSTLVYFLPNVSITYGVKYRVEIRLRQDVRQGQFVYWLGSAPSSYTHGCSGTTITRTGLERPNFNMSLTFETRNGGANGPWFTDQQAMDYNTKLTISTFGDSDTSELGFWHFDEYMFPWQEFTPQPFSD
jgi:hypothetical protein